MPWRCPSPQRESGTCSPIPAAGTPSSREVPGDRRSLAPVISQNASLTWGRRARDPTGRRRSGSGSSQSACSVWFGTRKESVTGWSLRHELYRHDLSFSTPFSSLPPSLTPFSFPPSLSFLPPFSFPFFLSPDSLFLLSSISCTG